MSKGQRTALDTMHREISIYLAAMDIARDNVSINNYAMCANIARYVHRKES